MLVRLSVRDIVLIERLDIEFDAGLAVVTGETGAGKSILLDAFALALGGRGDASLVRTGAPQGQVTAVFDLSPKHPVWAHLAEAGLAPGEELILRRTQFADGRSRATANDEPVSVQTLRQIGRLLVEIHGQHDERALVDASAHRDLLDAFGGLGAEAARVAGLWRQAREAREAVEAHRARIAQAAREADYLRHAVEEMSALAPQAGEENALAERRTLMMQSEKIAGDLKEAIDAVAGDHSLAISGAMRRLDRRGRQAEALVEPSVKAMDAALLALDEARGRLEEALRATEFDPAELERIEERLFALRAAARKYNVAADALHDLAARFAADLALIDAGEAELGALEKKQAAAEKAFGDAAAALSAARIKAGAALDKAVSTELKPLKLERARFMTVIEADAAQPGAHGIDRVGFQVQTNPGSNPGPMMKVASGGELSRFLLALKVALADRGSAPTLVFDEIDTGVGGAVADAIGQRLSRLSRKVQVITVTHAPQVAARADHHFLITKSTADRGRRVVTEVMSLASDPRREEIARMLAGAEITSEARAAADRLLRAAAS